VDFFHVDIVLPRRLSVLFFIEHGRRRVHLAGVTVRPTVDWVVQQARNLLTDIDDQVGSLRFLIRDRDTKFTRSFNAAFTAAGVKILHTPVRAPQANAIAERWVGSVRRKCLDRILIMNRHHLQQVLAEYVDHFNTHRPHRSLNQQPPDDGAYEPYDQAPALSSAEIDSADPSTNITRSHDLTPFSAPTGSASLYLARRLASPR
jgi:putative transposase